MRKLGQKGFTLIELLIVIAVISIISVTAYFSMGDRGEKAQLKSAARDLASNMNLARTRAIRDTRPWAILFITTPGANSYTIYSDSGEPFAPADPLDPVDWTDGDETTFRTVTLPQKVSFGSHQGTLNGDPVGDGVSYADYIDPGGVPLENLVVLNPNGTISESGEVYFVISGHETFAVSNIAATGRVKIQNNYGSGWSH